MCLRPVLFSPPVNLTYLNGFRSMTDLCDSLTMPPDLVKAHQELNKAVGLCCCPQPMINETKRVEFPFEPYDRYKAGLFKVEK